MGVQKKEIPPPSCPMWLATYGDLVTNMLVFFVLLVSMSEIKKEDRFMEFMQAMREAFGYAGGIDLLPTEKPLDVKNVDLAQMLIVPIQPENYGESSDPGVHGENPAVRDIRRGQQYIHGAPIPFAPVSVELTPEAAARIDTVAAELRGLYNQVHVRGHCSRQPVDGTPFRDHLELSLARARAVTDTLIAAGVEPDRIVVVGAGANEPIVVEAYKPEEWQRNDRVEVLQIDVAANSFGTPASRESGTPTSRESGTP